jgi:hypothetical protein
MDHIVFNVCKWNELLILLDNYTMRNIEHVMI